MDGDSTTSTSPDFEPSSSYTLSRKGERLCLSLVQISAGVHGLPPLCDDKLSTFGGVGFIEHSVSVTPSKISITSELLPHVQVCDDFGSVGR